MILENISSMIIGGTSGYVFVRIIILKKKKSKPLTKEKIIKYIFEGLIYGVLIAFALKGFAYTFFDKTGIEL